MLLASYGCPVPTRDDAEAAVILGCVGLLWRSRVAALTDLGEGLLLNEGIA